jgi:uncharacterized protein
MEINVLILFVGFFFIALIYSSVGFGGGSSYLALMAQPFFALLPEAIVPTALLCNLVVVTGGSFYFYREGKINLKTSWPFLVSSVPLAYLGGYWKLQQHTFFVLLGFSLVAASFFLWIQPEKLTELPAHWKSNRFKFGLGGGIGLLSGMVGIGGGIFLSPVLHLLNWENARRISALASLFILANSLAGLAGKLSGNGIIDWSLTWPLLIAVFCGGMIGSRLGSQTFKTIYIKRITAVLVLAAGLNILRAHLF